MVGPFRLKSEDLEELIAESDTVRLPSSVPLETHVPEWPNSEPVRPSTAQVRKTLQRKSLHARLRPRAYVIHSCRRES